MLPFGSRSENTRNRKRQWGVSSNLSSVCDHNAASVVTRRALRTLRKKTRSDEYSPWCKDPFLSTHKVHWSRKLRGQHGRTPRKEEGGWGPSERHVALEGCSESCLPPPLSDRDNTAYAVENRAGREMAGVG